LLFLAANNLFYSAFPWALFCVPGVLMWPAALLLRGRLGRARIALALYALAAAYYAVLNILVAPGHPWAVYVAFALMWYPASVALVKKGALAIAVFGLIWSVLFYGAVNLLTSPWTIWAVYPIFAVLWWPMSIYFFGARKRPRTKNY
jgi:hypothetical protein